MTTNDFWNIIDQARPDSCDIGKFNQNLMRLLESLPDEDLLYFDYFFGMYEGTVIASPNRLIWSALSLVYSGKHTYHTYGFADWLILQGRSKYLAVLHDADQLSDTEAAPNYCSGSLKGHEHEYPEQRYLASRIYCKRNCIGIRAVRKIANEFAQKADIEWQDVKQRELNIPTYQRNRDWTLEDLAAVLPKTYRKYIMCER